MFSQEKADAICELLAEGLSLRKSCEQVGSIGVQTVLDWTKKNPDFSGQYARAREVGYQLLADEILEISDDSDPLGDKMDPERVARARLRVDSRKWMLSKMLPKVYGDKIETTHSGEIGIRSIERHIIDPAH